MKSRAYKKSMESRAYTCCFHATNPKIVAKALDSCRGSCIMDFVELIKKANL
jgi:3-hydroxy-3-methylglutaryl CoA synthase